MNEPKLQQPLPGIVSPSSKLTRSRRGLLIKVKSGRVVTPEMVKELSEDDLDGVSGESAESVEDLS